MDPNEQQLSLNLNEINRPAGKEGRAGEVSIKSRAVRDLPGSEDAREITLGIDRFGRHFLSITCDSANDSNQANRDKKVAEAIGIEVFGFANAEEEIAKGEMTPTELVRRKKLEGERTFYIDSSGKHEISGGRGPSYVTNIASRARNVIDDDHLARHLALIQSNRQRIAEIVSDAVHSRTLTSEQGRQILDLPFKAFGIEIDPLRRSLYKRM